VEIEILLRSKTNEKQDFDRLVSRLKAGVVGGVWNIPGTPVKEPQQGLFVFCVFCLFIVLLFYCFVSFCWFWFFMFGKKLIGESEYESMNTIVIFFFFFFFFFKI
jgi:phosphate starvation-inducible membrane PsiE